MSEELQQKLRDQALGGRKPFAWQYCRQAILLYFTLGFIFYKYLSEKIETYANSALDDDEVTFKELWGNDRFRCTGIAGRG